jgi:hypothetical protein
MNSEKIIEDMARDILFLKAEIDRLSKLTPLYEVKNTAPIEALTADQNNYPLGN